jgi:uncharacterized protein YuzE
MRLMDYFPEFASQLAEALAEAGDYDIGQSFSESSISTCTYDSSCHACYIYVEPSRLLNTFEIDMMGVKHGRTIEVNHPFWVYIDVDNFDRPVGIELLNASSIFIQRLVAWSPY